MFLSFYLFYIFPTRYALSSNNTEHRDKPHKLLQFVLIMCLYMIMKFGKIDKNEIVCY